MQELLNAIYERKPDVVFRVIAGDVILVPIRKNVGDMESIYTLNETAARVWEMIDGNRTAKAILEQLVKEFDVDPQKAEQDLLELLRSMLEIGEASWS